MIDDTLKKSNKMLPETFETEPRTISLAERPVPSTQ